MEPSARDLAQLVSLSARGAQLAHELERVNNLIEQVLARLDEDSPERSEGPL